MNNLIAISLTPRAKVQIRTITREVLPYFGRVRVTNSHIILKKHIFARRRKIILEDFLLEVLPKEMKRWELFKETESPLIYFGNTVEFLLHLDSIGERNVIPYLWKCYNSVITSELLQEQDLPAVHQVRLICMKHTTDVMATKVVSNLKRMQKLVKGQTFITQSKQVLNVVFKSPDIRGSPVLSTYIQERQIS